jgi:protein MPE1
MVKRLPAARPGKGRASMYANGTGPAMPTSDAVARGAGGPPTWHKGAMSKRFDGKDETPLSSTLGTVKPVAPVKL